VKSDHHSGTRCALGPEHLDLDLVTKQRKLAANGAVAVSGALVVRGHLDELQLLRAARIVNPDTPIARA
jgi:hypothetical protein